MFWLTRRHALRVGLAISAAIVMCLFILTGLSATHTASAGGAIRYVDGAGGSDDSDCTDAGDPCATIGYAVDQAVDQNAVYISAGTYPENIVYDSKSLLIKGGFTISGTNWLTRTGETIVDGGDADRVFFIHSNNSVLEDLTIMNGHAPDMEPWGGGIWVTNGDFEMRRTRVMSNVNGGVEVNSDFGPVNLMLEKSILAQNQGTGLNVSESESAATIINVLVYGNGGDPGGIRLGSGNMMAGHLSVINSTIADNVGPAGIRIEEGGTFTLTNSIVWGNNGLDLECAATCTVTYSDMDGGWAGTGNINADPLFVSPVMRDYRLTGGSPAIDAGTPMGAPVDDLDGNPRDAMPDMGAYEYLAPTSVLISSFADQATPVSPFWLVLLPLAICGLWLVHRQRKGMLT